MGPSPLVLFASPVHFQSVPAASRAAACGSTEKREPVAALPRRKRAFFVPLPRIFAASVSVAGAWGLRLSFYYGISPLSAHLRNAKTTRMQVVLIAEWAGKNQPWAGL